MDFDEREEEMEMAGSGQPAGGGGGYDSLSNSSSGRPRLGLGGAGDVGATSAVGGGRKPGAVRYKECLKNHALSIGGHAVDGCGEFMPAGEDGSLDALRCAACGCHRNFHRKDTDASFTSGFHHHISPPYYRAPPYLHLTPAPAGTVHPHRPLALPAAGAAEEEDVSNPSSSGGGGSGGLKKRFRTKFTAEQKEKMLGFAERLGWRIQKHDEAAVEQFCAETGVKRQVLKVWMHNNKHTLGKKP